MNWLMKNAFVVATICLALLLILSLLTKEHKIPEAMYSAGLYCDSEREVCWARLWNIESQSGVIFGEKNDPESIFIKEAISRGIDPFYD